MKQAPDMELKKELALRIRKIRTEALLSQAAFAKSIEVSRVHLNRMEAPDIEMMPSRPVLERICSLYKVNYEWLMTGNGDTYQKDTEADFIHNDKFMTVSPAIVKQCTEYVSLKATTLLKKETMDERRFSRYFQLFTSLIDLIFRLMTEIREYYISKTDIPEMFYDAYIEEFKKILKG